MDRLAEVEHSGWLARSQFAHRCRHVAGHAQTGGIVAIRAQDANDVVRYLLHILARFVLGIGFGSLEVAIVDDCDPQTGACLHDASIILVTGAVRLQPGTHTLVVVHQSSSQTSR
jgi:hypothetical protein